MRIRLRPSCPEDVWVLWRWSNDPETRRASFHPARIARASHLKWYREKLACPHSVRIYVAESEAGQPVGQLRLEVDRRRRAIISISVAAEARGKGVAKRMLTLGARRAGKDLRVRQLWAYVKADNSASLNLFRSAGFRKIRSLWRGGMRSVLFSGKAR
jgi:RimJ/RimL family protein N-acetyltransferase